MFRMNFLRKTEAGSERKFNVAEWERLEDLDLHPSFETCERYNFGQVDSPRQASGPSFLKWGLYLTGLVWGLIEITLKRDLRGAWYAVLFIPLLSCLWVGSHCTTGEDPPLGSWAAGVVLGLHLWPG